MYMRNMHKFSKSVKVIYPGDCYVTVNDEYIGTLLGSCVAVCLYDPVNKVAGMNHFVLPGKIVQSSGKKRKHDDKPDETELLKYGTKSIESLIKKMEKHGNRKHFVAKLFGGGKVLDYQVSRYGISSMNVRIAKILLEMADIPIVSQDVGDDYARKILFDTGSGKVYCKQLKKINKDDTQFSVELMPVE